jgi:hypothetical protein
MEAFRADEVQSGKLWVPRLRSVDVCPLQIPPAPGWQFHIKVSRGYYGKVFAQKEKEPSVPAAAGRRLAENARRHSAQNLLGGWSDIIRFRPKAFRLAFFLFPQWEFIQGVLGDWLAWVALESSTTKLPKAASSTWCKLRCFADNLLRSYLISISWKLLRRPMWSILEL